MSDGLPFYNYGTAGFRFKAEFMDGLMLRVGILSMILLLLEHGDDAPSVDLLSTGVMVTASHNDESYNGVKLSNPDGSMLTPSHEAFLTKWVNERNAGEFLSGMLEAKAKEFAEKNPRKAKYVLHIGRDTRSHSERLTELLKKGASLCMEMFRQNSDDFGGKIVIEDHGVLTTPMLHHIVLHTNPRYLPSYIEPKNTRSGYIQTYARAYFDLLEGLQQKRASSSDSGSGKPLLPLVIDGACGVGFKAGKEIHDEINRLLAGGNNNDDVSRPFVVRNGETDGPLNDSCGSEHVQKELRPPTWYDGSSGGGGDDDSAFDLPYCCSFDGDADRIVFFAQKSETELAHLLDGDKIAVLIAVFLKEYVSSAEAAASASPAGDAPSIKVGVVQTAYANGASTDYVKNVLELPVIITKTGVKHLHHAAVEHFDVGVYFEANGHGTVVFSKNYERFAEEQLEKHNNPLFVRLHRLINPAVGDALSDMLLVDYFLQSLRWDLGDWNSKFYTDLPSRMKKVKVQDRRIIECNHNETVCLEPTAVQPALREAMDSVEAGRTFIRPSGTEDVVRVYAEAKTEPEADKLAEAAMACVRLHCHGI